MYIKNVLQVAFRGASEEAEQVEAAGEMDETQCSSQDMRPVVVAEADADDIFMSGEPVSS